MHTREHMKQVILTYPDLFPLNIMAYIHIYLTIGNGYEWKNGELVYEGETTFFNNQEEAIKNVIDDTLFRLRDARQNTDPEVFDQLVTKFSEEANRDIHTILHVDEILDDYSIPDDPEFKFRLNKYSAIANIPDDIEWSCLTHVMDFVAMLDENRDKLDDPDSLLDGIKERIETLYFRWTEKIFIPWKFVPRYRYCQYPEGDCD